MMTDFQWAIISIILVIVLPVIVGIFCMLSGVTPIGPMIGTLVLVGFGLFVARMMFD